MSYEQYWYGDVFDIRYYLEAEKLRKRRVDQECHLQGLYIYQALCNVSPIFRDFAKKGTKPIPYPNEPFTVTAEKKKSEEEQDRIMEAERLKAIWYFRTWARNVGKKFGK